MRPVPGQVRDISIHAPVKGATVKLLEDAPRDAEFQSTLP